MKSNPTFWMLYALCLPFIQLSAQPITFQKTYGGAGNQVGNYVLEVNGGGYLIAGSTADPNMPSDGYLLRVDATGGILWQSSIGGEAADGFNVVQPTDDGGFIALGETQSDSAGSSDSWLVKVTAAGNVQWQRTFGGFGTDFGRALLVIPGGYIISGPQSSAGSGNQNTHIIRVDNAGATIWSKAYSTAIANILHVEYAEGNTLFACGGADTRGGFVTIDAFTGNVLNALSFGGPGPEALYHTRPTLDGNLVLANHTWSVTNGAEFRYWVRKVTKTGAPIWSKTYGIPGLMMRGRIETVSDGGFLLNPRQDNPTNPSNDAYLVKLNATGDIVWAYNYGGPSTIESLSRVQETADSGIVAVGHYRALGGNLEILLLKTDAQGLIAGCCRQPSNFVTIDYDAPNESLSLSEEGYFNGEAVNLPQEGQAYTGTDYCPNAQPIDSTVIILCPGQSFTISGSAYTAPAVVSDTLSGTAGCDSIVVYTLLAAIQPTLSDSLALCPGESVNINGVVYTQPGTVLDTLPATGGGCDTIATYYILRGDSPTLQQTVSFCPGDSVVINGVTYTQADTTISYLIAASIGCDTLVAVFLAYSSQPIVTKTISFCPGDSVSIDGVVYSQPGTVSGIITAATGCDTVVTYVLQFLSQPTVTKTIAFCPGDSVTIAGVTYSQPGTVAGVIAAATGCDTLATYILQFLPQPAVTKTIAFCPGDSVTIEGTVYTQPGTVSGVIAAATGCDTLATYVLQFTQQPTLSQLIEFCAGDSVTIGGINYTQPGTVNLVLPSTTGGCDTLAMYLLQYLVPSQPTSIILNCPGDIFVDADPGQSSVPVSYTLPTATSDCPCPGLNLSLQQGLVSGSNFPLGATTVCYNGKDSCTNSITCCFNVTVEEKAACDVKVINCIKYELLSITQDAQQRKTYRIRTTNNCANRLIYMAVQVPNGVVADLPVHNTLYAAPSSRTYLVRNPNYSPFYSVRYSSVSDSIQNGESDVFKYTLPPQADPDYIHVMVKLEPNIYHEAHLNTFFCPIEYEPNNRSERDEARQDTEGGFGLFPNPTDGLLFADLSTWRGQKVQLRVFSAQGRLIQSAQVLAEEQAQALELPAGLAKGLYFLEVLPMDGQKFLQRFVVQD